MGCGGSKTNELDEDYINSHKVVGIKFDKEQINYSVNPNKYILENKNFYLDQNPKEDEDFIDDKFESGPSSIKGKFPKGCPKDIEFKSAKEIWGENADIFGEGPITLEDIKLGKGKDAYFVAVLAALAEFPILIIQLFKTMKYKPGKAIQIALNIEGKWKIVSIDDKFPVEKGTNTPIFSNANNNKLWGVFLEKAWAKINNGWLNICKGNPYIVFNALTPYTTIPINVIKENKLTLWENIKDADAYCCIMTCSTSESTPGLANKGLIANHTFSLVSAFEKEVSGTTYKLMKLRNPFGEGEWNGDYSDKSEKWTNELKTAFNFEEAKDDGIFWIDYENFIRYFAKVSICIPLRPIICYNLEIEENNSEKLNYLKVKIIKSGILSITIHKELKKFHSDCLDEQNDAIENIIVAKIDKENKKLIYFDSAYNETSSCTAMPGEYLVLFGVDYKSKEVPGRKYRITLSGNCEFKISNIECDNDFSILKSILIPRVENLEKYKKKMDNDKIILFCGNRFENSAFCWFYLKNPQKDEISIHPYFVMKNFKKIEDFPNVIKLKPNVPVVFLGNRFNANLAFQSGISANIINPNGKEKEIELNQEFINNVFKESSYNDMEIEIEM
jgi:hypothetical protein